MKDRRLCYTGILVGTVALAVSALGAATWRVTRRDISQSYGGSCVNGCKAYNICISGEAACTDYETRDDCLGKWQKDGKGGDAYTCTGAPAPQCEPKDEGPCYIFYDCMWSDGQCKAQGFGETTDAYKDCD